MKILIDDHLTVGIDKLDGAILFHHSGKTLREEPGLCVTFRRNNWMACADIEITTIAPACITGQCVFLILGSNNPLDIAKHLLTRNVIYKIAMSTVLAKRNPLTYVLTVVVVVVSIIQNDRMNESAKRLMADVVTSCNKAQNKK